MLAKIYSAAVIGIDAYPVEIEVNVTGSSAPGGAESFISIVGLPDMAVKESRDRVRSAVQSSGFALPHGNTVVNLAPADLRKEGASFDLGIALAVLGSAGLINRAALAACAVVGELALDGSIRPVKGALPVAVTVASECKVRALLVPAENVEEAALGAAEKLKVYPVHTLSEAVEFLKTGNIAPYHADLAEYLQNTDTRYPADFAEVKGQKLARRALEIAAAGGHNALMIGPPGTGKSMLAMRMSSILPPMTLEETLEVSRIHSVCGLLSDGKPLVNARPFRAPHHTISDVGLIGGGRDPRPGEISLAHNGVLFLDELPEFKRNVLEVLRQPLESGSITVSRAAGSCTFPADFMLIAAMNPCPCGRGAVELGCTCTIEEKRRYQRRISGPLLDRIDLHIELRQLSEEELLAAPDGESSAVIRSRVIAARQLQQARFASRGLFCNSQMGSREIEEFCQVSPSSQQLLRQAIARFKLSPRAYSRILKVARTIADLSGENQITDAAIFEALTYRKSSVSAE